jgi:hypothetical protein
VPSPTADRIAPSNRSLTVAVVADLCRRRYAPRVATLSKGEGGRHVNLRDKHGVARIVVS